MSRRIAAYLFFLFLSGLALGYWPHSIEPVGESPRGAALTGGPMIQIGNTDGRTAMAVVWRTAQRATSRIDYGPTPALGRRVVDHGLTAYHALTLHNLEPSRRYYYRIASNGQTLADAFFQTGKSAREAFRFAVFGDSGSGKTAQYQLAKLIEKYAVDMILHTGDVVYFDGEDKHYREKFYLPYRTLLDRIPIFPVMGNHDYETQKGQPWLDNFFLPEAERFYSFDYGNAHFTALDSNRINAATARWLEQDLAKTEQTWKFVFFHEPPFSNKEDRTGSAGARNLWLPLFAKYKVDIVFSGHDHMYTRFKARAGVLYIVEGTGGYSLYKANPHARHVEFTDNSEFGFGLVEVDGPRLVFRHVKASGAYVDTFTLTKGLLAGVVAHAPAR